MLPRGNPSRFPLYVSGLAAIFRTFRGIPRTSAALPRWVIGSFRKRRNPFLWLVSKAPRSLLLPRGNWARADDCGKLGEGR